VDWLLGFLVASLLVVAIVLGWRFHLLRRRMEAYARAVRRVADNALPASELPEDEKGLEELANAVKTLALSQQVQTSGLETERARLASILEQMTDGVLIADSQGRVTFLNPAAKRIFSAEDAPGQTVAQVIRQYQLVEAWKHSCETGQPQEESVELPSRRQFLQLVILPDPQTGGSLLLVQDLTRVRRLEAVRRDFVSNVSHELRTPLASLKALTETLRDGALSDPKAAPRFLGRIETEVDALTQMATELLDLSRIESGQVSLELAAVDPIKLIQSAAERMRAQAERAGLTLSAQETAALPRVQADAGRLEQVLVNLIHNAVKFTGPGGSVTLSAEADRKFVRFAVKDSGVGIPEDDLERVFERFYKSDRARSGGGTGLGLSIARHIVEAHGGRIWAESVEGQGSTFSFTIPVS
jgi:two-component system, OmpR family, phosphate regulon sensor histidine kinase PhoR